MVQSNSVKPNSLEEQLYRLFIPLTNKITAPDFERKLEQADIAIDMDFYLSKNLFFAVFAFLLILIIGSFLVFITDIFLMSTLVLIAITIFFLIIGYTIINPYVLVNMKVNSIKTNLPLSILGMSSVAESGAPPEAIFSTSSVKYKDEYISKEFDKIIYYIDNLGISLLEAIDIVAKKTPSFELKKFILDLKSNLEAGGSLSEFMKKKADHARFEYKIMLDTQNKKAEAFGDIYSAIVIAGPLFLFSGIMLLGMVGTGGIGGLSIPTLMMLGVFVLVPLMNVIFLLVLNLT